MTPEKALHSPVEDLLRVLQGFWLSRAVYVAAKLGIADLVRDQPRTAADLAQATGTHAPSLYRVLRALASEGWFSEDKQGRFSLEPPARALLTGALGSLRWLTLLELGEERYPGWGEILHSVRTGEPAFDHAFGMPVWDFYSRNPGNAEGFARAMQDTTALLEPAILFSYRFSSFRKIVDVGGGNGSLMAAVLKWNNRTRGVLFDLPHATQAGRRRIIEERLEDRCEVVAGDFFESVPEGGDAYVLKWIIHDWDDDRSVAILRNCHRAMRDGSRVVLIEAVLPGPNQPFFHKFVDLDMLVSSGGRERTEAEYRKLLEAAGFGSIRIVPTPSEVSVIEAARA